MNEFKNYLTSTKEYGIVTEIHHSLVVGTGLPGARPKEKVVFETGGIGEIFALEKDRFSALVFADEPLTIGTRVARTNAFLSVPVGDGLLGAIIDPLGTALAREGKIRRLGADRAVDCPVKGLTARAKITRPFLTGVGVVDLLIPLGKGQRELVIGDRKTGKTSFLLSVVKNQAREGTVIVYALIGKKQSEIKKVEEFLQAEKIETAVVVAGPAASSPGLICLTPFTAMTIGEYFCDQGRDVLVILDDLSTHARFYREFSLLGRSFPGRDSYPGDIFYVQAKLLERAGNFKFKTTEAALTCLPVAETIDSDLTGYIPTNLMGMTDGHIFFDSNVYAKGRRPAINIALSVTRVGRQTQSGLEREINRKLTAFLANLERVADYSHFGAELTEEVKETLVKGEWLYAFFDQHYQVAVPQPVVLLLFTLIWLGALKEWKLTVPVIRDKLIAASGQAKTRKLFTEIVSVQTFAELSQNVLKAIPEIMKIVLS